MAASAATTNENNYASTSVKYVSVDVAAITYRDSTLGAGVLRVSRTSNECSGSWLNRFGAVWIVCNEVNEVFRVRREQLSRGILQRPRGQDMCTSGVQ